MQVVRGYGVERFVAQALTTGMSAASLAEQDWDAQGRSEMIFRECVLPFCPTIPAPQIVEIGTGIGLLTEQVVRHLPTCRIYSYEPNRELEEYLSKRFWGHLLSMPCDGSTVAGLRAQSVDMAVAYGVFVYVDEFLLYTYLRSLFECLKPHACVVFDIFDTDQQSKELLEHFSVFAERRDPRRYLSGAFCRFIAESLGYEFVIARKCSSDPARVFYVFRKPNSSHRQ